MTTARLLALAFMPRRQLETHRTHRTYRTHRTHRAGDAPNAPPSSRPAVVTLAASLRPHHRVALRTNLTFRELAACASISSSTAHRIVAAFTPVLAQLIHPTTRDLRFS